MLSLFNSKQYNSRKWTMCIMCLRICSYIYCSSSNNCLYFWKFKCYRMDLKFCSLQCCSWNMCSLCLWIHTKCRTNIMLSLYSSDSFMSCNSYFGWNGLVSYSEHVGFLFSIICGHLLFGQQWSLIGYIM